MTEIAERNLAHDRVGGGPLAAAHCSHAGDVVCGLKALNDCDRLHSIDA
jgi:hypothetical protein